MRLEPLVNPEVIESLPQVEPVYARSYLTSKNGEVLYRFLFNPEVLDFSKQARYSEVEVGGTAVQPQYYKNTSGTTLRLNDLQFDSYCEKRSSRELIEGLGRLTLPDPQTLKPVEVSFVFGSFLFGPAILTDLSWTASGFINGEPAVGTINISLTEIPKQTLPSAYSTRRVEPVASTTNATTAASVPANLPLTVRQQETIREQALSYIGSNLNRFPINVRQAYSAGRLQIVIPSADQINMIENNTNLGSFGSYDLVSQTLKPLATFL